MKGLNLKGIPRKTWHIISLIAVSVVCVVGLVIFLTVLFNKNGDKVYVVDVSGDVGIADSLGTNIQPLRVGTQLNVSDVVITGRNSSCILAYKDKPTMRDNYISLSENTQVNLYEKHEDTGGYGFFVVYGSLICNMPNMEPYTTNVATMVSKLYVDGTISKVSYDNEKEVSKVYAFAGNPQVQLVYPSGTKGGLERIVKNSTCSISNTGINGVAFDYLNVAFGLDGLSAQELKTMSGIAGVRSDLLSYTNFDFETAFNRAPDKDKYIQTQPVIITTAPIETLAPVGTLMNDGVSETNPVANITDGYMPVDDALATAAANGYSPSAMITTLAPEDRPKVTKFSRVFLNKANEPDDSDDFDDYSFGGMNGGAHNDVVVTTTVSKTPAQTTAAANTTARTTTTTTAPVVTTTTLYQSDNGGRTDNSSSNSDTTGGNGYFGGKYTLADAKDVRGLYPGDYRWACPNCHRFYYTTDMSSEEGHCSFCSYFYGANAEYRKWEHLDTSVPGRGANANGGSGSSGSGNSGSNTGCHCTNGCQCKDGSCGCGYKHDENACHCDDPEWDNDDNVNDDDFIEDEEGKEPGDWGWECPECHTKFYDFVEDVKGKCKYCKQFYTGKAKATTPKDPDADIRLVDDDPDETIRVTTAEVTTTTTTTYQNNAPGGTLPSVTTAAVTTTTFPYNGKYIPSGTSLQHNPNAHIVIFSYMDRSGQEFWSMQLVYHGYAAQAPTVPYINGFQFAYYNKDFSCVQYDMVIRAVFVPNEYWDTTQQNSWNGGIPYSYDNNYYYTDPSAYQNRYYDGPYHTVFYFVGDSFWESKFTKDGWSVQPDKIPVVSDGSGTEFIGWTDSCNRVYDDKIVYAMFRDKYGNTWY